jgi:hypothetical protein
VDWLTRRRRAISASRTPAARHCRAWSHAATPDDPGRLVPNPARKAAAAGPATPEILAAAAQAQRDASLAPLRTPPGQPVTITNQMINAQDAAAVVPARIRLGEIAPDMVRLEACSKRLPTKLTSRVSAGQTIKQIM